MSVDAGLLAYLAPRLASHPEDLATEALAFILTRCHSAGDSFTRLLGQLNITSAHGLHFATQRRSEVAGDNSRPDLACLSDDGSLAALVEAKFWADLTDSQPISYLEQLPSDGGLLFLCPANRMVLLWPELLRRVADTSTVEVAVPSGARVVRLTSGRILAMASWEFVLGTIQMDLVDPSDRSFAHNVLELQSLCRHFDGAAYTPVRPEELAKVTPGRMLQYLKLVDQIVEAAQISGLCNRGNSRTGASAERYGRYFWIRGVGCWLGVEYRRWATQSLTPIWLEVHGANWSDWQRVADRLAPLAGRGLLVMEPGEKPAMPVHIPTGVEFQQVIDAGMLAFTELNKALDAALSVPHLPAGGQPIVP